MSDLETRIAKLEAAEEIKRLKYRHIQLTDAGYPVDDLTKLWVEDGVWEGIFTDVDERWADVPGTGEFRGHEGIQQFWELNGELYQWVLHIMVSPDITVNDDLVTASGKWHWLMPCVRKIDREPAAAWLGGFQTDRYRKEDGVWKFHTVRVDLKVMAGHSAGWYPDRYIAEPPVS